jgi:threonine dehydrogenase-like Zn-dependent dehydrogenase
MRAITVQPSHRGSARLETLRAPSPIDGTVLVETLAVGICGTDVEIVSGLYGWAPPGRSRLVLGHESIGRVVDAPERGDFQAGDLVVGMVRQPDPVPCANCRVGEWDMCRNGRYTEHGIKECDGFGAEQFRIRPDHLVRVDLRLGSLGVLLEPASVVAKAWEQIERIGARSQWSPRKVLVTGAGPIGLLAALLGMQRGLDVHVLDRVTDGPKPELMKALGAQYHTGPVNEVGGDIDIVLECTGVGQLVWDVMLQVAPGGIVCLIGVSAAGRTLGVDLGALNRELVLENNVVFGSVNANRRHYEAAARALAAADSTWLGQLITRRVPLARWSEAFQRDAEDVKTIVEFAAI